MNCNTPIEVLCAFIYVIIHNIVNSNLIVVVWDVL